MLNETNIECFLILAETKSFTETAKRVYLTQQAVSKNITNLENEFGFPLFYRSAKVLSLTKEGEECRIFFEKIQKDYTDIIEVLRKSAGKTNEGLRVGYQNYLELGVGIINANNAMRENMPDSRIFGVRYSPSELNRRLLDGTLDLIIICDRYFLGGAEFEGRELFKVPSTIMVSPDNPNVTEASTYMDFRSEPYLVDRFEHESTADFNRRVKKEIDMAGLRPVNVVTMPNRESAYSAAEMGSGVLLGSEISQTARGSRLLRYRTGSMETISCFFLKQSKNELLTTFTELLIEACKNG